jgi:hypothetical protein
MKSYTFSGRVFAWPEKATWKGKVTQEEKVKCQT